MNLERVLESFQFFNYMLKLDGFIEVVSSA